MPTMLLYKNPEVVETSEPEVSENEGEAEQTDRLEIVSEEQADSIEELLEEIEIELPEEESSDQPVDEPPVRQTGLQPEPRVHRD